MGLPGTDFPRIAGLPAGYILRQLHDLGDSNRRDAPVMKTIVSAFSEEELQAVANSVSQMPVSFTAKALTGAERPRTAGEALALQGDWTRNIPACTACHGPDGVGVGEAFPALQGQNAGYLSSQLSAWQRGARKNDPNDLMGAVARSLSAAEIRSVSDYFANLPLDGGRP
ncbi:MAG: Cytochrome c4 [Stenotrophomonas maltophilia]|nr:MAG: Cytochrome c4 [Stenotrophomonas maltophilia]